MLYNTDGVESFIDNSHHLNIKFPRNWSHLYNRFMQISEETNSPALLYVCGYPLLSVQTPSASSDRTMTFDYPGAYPIELYDSLINGTEIPSDIFFSVGTCCYNDIPFDPESDPSIYGVESIIDDDINKLKNSFKENCDTAEIRKFSRKHGSISINLHLYPDSGLPNRGLNTVQSILKDLSFQGSSIISLDFYLSSSTSSQDAICKISFKKNISDHSYYDSDVTDGTISVSAEIHGGVFTDYQQQFQEVYNNSEFFSQYGDVEWVFDAE